jgi:hypothetical protein
VAFCMDFDYKRTYRFCMKCFLYVKITNMATVRMFYVISDKLCTSVSYAHKWIIKL